MPSPGCCSVEAVRRPRWALQVILMSGRDLVGSVRYRRDQRHAVHIAADTVADLGLLGIVVLMLLDAASC